MLEVLIILILLILNGLFAMSEIALVSSRKSKLQQKADEGSTGAKTALKLLEEPEKFLSTVQIGITLVGIVAGAYGGGAFTEDLKPLFEQSDLLKPYAEEIAFGIVVTLITYFSLIIGELVPKSIAMNNPEGITITFAPFMRALSTVTYPFVVFLSISTKVFLKIFMLKERTEPPVTEEELKYLIDTGSQHGVIEKQESEIMQSVFRFGDRKAQSLMTHRNEIFWLDINKDKTAILQEIKETGFTKYPVCEDKIDNVRGFVSVIDVLFLAELPGEFKLESVLKEPVFIPSGMPALKVLDFFRKQRIHFAFVVDEYGGINGLITLHDLVENIMGDLPDFEEEVAQITKRDEISWFADADIKIDEVKKVIGIPKFPGEESYSTLAGFIMNQMYKIPVAGESCTYMNYKFEVVDMDGNRIDKVLIHKLP
ncbi:MAG: hemolysin family protein [Bacteroidia bacterium]|nr:hemolysin family protein [Bacteroidia bacterium]